jgi:hypothetical protein
LLDAGLTAVLKQIHGSIVTLAHNSASKFSRSRFSATN